MKYLFCAFCLSALFFIFSTSTSFALNRIEGLIFDENRAPVGELYVELIGDSGATMLTLRATPLGRFTFPGLVANSYSVRVLPSGKNFLEQTKDVQFVGANPRGNETQFLEFYLRYDKRAANAVNQGPPEAVFVQDIPDSARKRYKAAADLLDARDDKGIDELESVINFSPNYFDALSRLGKEYLVRKKFDKAYPYLVRAIDINPRSYSSFYALAYAFVQLDQLAAAMKAIQACTVLRADSVEAQVMYGTILRLTGLSEEAETTLKKALSLAKGPNAEIHWQLALLYNKLSRNKEAADELEIYLKIKPDAPDKKAIKDLITKLRATK